MVRVRGDLCSGCGTCVEVCPRGALTLVDQKAEVDVDRCTGCGLCIDACPTGAILTTAPIARPLPATSYPLRPARDLRNPPMWLTAGRAFIERWLMPMAADRLISVLERRLSAVTSPAATQANRHAVAAAQVTGRGHRRRMRWRGRLLHIL